MLLHVQHLGLKFERTESRPASPGNIPGVELRATGPQSALRGVGGVWGSRTRTRSRKRTVLAQAHKRTAA